MNQDDKRKLETGLMKLGLAGLDKNGNPSGELVEQIAAMVNHWHPVENRMGEWIDQHNFLRDLLAECDEAQRSAMYDAIVPHLNFKPLPLSQYELRIAEKVGKMVSQRRMRVEGDAPKPIEVGGAKYAAAPKAIATHAVVGLTCHRCRKFERFIAETPVGAMTDARKAGWTLEKGVNKETCPECSEALAATLVRLSNTETLAVYDRRTCKLDA